ncbi:MAG: hypothetical protein V1798_11005 [Pseudomonadota bacterium]
MKKSFLLMAIALVATVAIVRCGGGSNLKTASEASFTSPSGTITNANATAVVQSVVDTGKVSEAVGGLLNGLGVPTTKIVSHAIGALRKVLPRQFPGIRSLDASSLGDCASIATDQKSGSVNLQCLSDAGLLEGTGCTAAGTFSYSINGDDTESTMTLSGFTVSCTGGEFSTLTCNGSMNMNGDLAVLFSGQEVSTASFVACTDLSCSIDSVSESFTGCTFNGELLVDDGLGGEVVCAPVAPAILCMYPGDADCLTLISTWKVKDSTATVQCNITEKSDGCSATTTITSVGSCTVL